MTNTTKYIAWGGQILAALILLQTLFFKFTGAPESIYIFTKLGIEPWGRYLSGGVELIAGILLLSGVYSWVGAIIALGVISGAIMGHLIQLGIEIMGDHGQLFIYALLVFISSALVLWIRRKEVPILNKYI